MRFTLPLLALVASIVVSSKAYADNVYTTLATYSAATTSSATIDFSGIVYSGGYDLLASPGSSFTLSGATFFSEANPYVFDNGYYGGSYADGAYLTVQGASPDVLEITLPTGTTAVGFNFGGLFGPSGDFTVTLSDGFTTTISTTDSIGGTASLDFAGFSSTGPLTSITISALDHPNYNAFDNFTFGSAIIATPEPSSFALLATGILGTAGVIRRRIFTR